MALEDEVRRLADVVDRLARALLSREVGGKDPGPAVPSAQPKPAEPVKVQPATADAVREALRAVAKAHNELPGSDGRGGQVAVDILKARGGTDQVAKLDPAKMAEVLEAARVTVEALRAKKAP